MHPSYTTILGSPLKNLRIFLLLRLKYDIITSATIKVSTGIIPVKSGISIACIGTDAKSEIIIATTSSDGCNSPSCLLPIIRIAAITIPYKIKVLTTSISIFHLRHFLLCIILFKHNIYVFHFTFTR